MRLLSSDEVNFVLKKKRSWILRACSCSGVTPAAIVAYGSASRIELREDSDLDIAIIFEDEDTVRRGREAVWGAEREDLWPLDLLFYSENEFHHRANGGGVCMIIREEGRVLYGSL